MKKLTSDDARINMWVTPLADLAEARHGGIWMGYNWTGVPMQIIAISRPLVLLSVHNGGHSNRPYLIACDLRSANMIELNKGYVAAFKRQERKQRLREDSPLNIDQLKINEIHGRLSLPEPRSDHDDDAEAQQGEA